jgi:hypothetical protein
LTPFGRILREPLLHFILIGGAVFLAFGLRNAPPERPSARVIEVTPARVERLAGQFQAVWRRPPTEEEVRALVEDFVREEVYYREALSLGLDRDDTVIRQRLRQKMEFLADSGAGTLAPSEEDLRRYYAAHRDAYAKPEQVTFQQIFLGATDPAAALAALGEGADPAAIGEGSLLPATLEAATRATVDGTFGSGFFAAVSALPAGVWQGPVESTFGPHLVRLVELEPGAVPAFEQVRNRVLDAWREQTAADLRESQYQAMRQRYEVVLPPDEASQ